jgi:hypothetical protein
MSRVVFQYSRLKRRVPRRTRGVAESLYGRSLSNEGNGFDRVPIPGSEHLVREAGTAPLYLHTPRGAREPARKGRRHGHTGRRQSPNRHHHRPTLRTIASRPHVCRVVGSSLTHDLGARDDARLDHPPIGLAAGNGTPTQPRRTRPSNPRQRGEPARYDSNSGRKVCSA